jgi:hypothetical protein
MSTISSTKGSRPVHLSAYCPDRGIDVDGEGVETEKREEEEEEK